MIALVWQFEVKPGKQGEFEAFYGADGAWTTLSRKSRSYLGSSFLRDLADTRRYLVAEYWSEMVVYEKHHSTFETRAEGPRTPARRAGGNRASRSASSTRSTYPTGPARPGRSAAAAWIDWVAQAKAWAY